ncbi:GL20300 [Drosophila persimilis]|uniref:GL20300 n=1 Tax=Drosophila persimilis TaxID=7234 RepID=B4GXK1_DROPE|nr:GL20300 [Drosophila persimilis]
MSTRCDGRDAVAASSNDSRSQRKSRKRQPNHQRTGQHQQQHQHQHQPTRWPELNVANEQAIRFRCPQVGPQVGRDLHTPQPMHFHHPQSQPQLQSQLQLQPKMAAGSKKSKRKSRQRQQQQQQQQKDAHAPEGTELTRSPATAGVQPRAAGMAAGGGVEVAQLPLPPLHVVVGGPGEGEGEGEEEQQLPATPDSPSLVTVSTWYTVAKQGVSC